MPRLGFRDVVAPEGAFYFYVDAGRYTADGLAFCRRLLEDTGVSLAPGIDFDPGERGRRCVRISFALRTPAVERALALLAAWLPKQPRVD